MNRRFLLLPGCVMVSLERGQAPEEIVPVLVEAAALARKEGRDALLVVSGFDDPASAPAVSQAIEAIRQAGAPPPSKIAFVAYLYPQYEAYRLAERFAEKHGMQAKVFVSGLEAKAWLGVPDSPPP